jgi:hypothetical protein
VDAGAVVEGIFSGMHEGKFGPLLDLDTADGRVTFPVPVVLERALSTIRVGASISIQYLGLQPAKVGDKSFHNFEVFADAEDLMVRRGAARQQPDGVEVPF